MRANLSIAAALGLLSAPAHAGTPGAAPADAGMSQAMATLTGTISRVWMPMCETEAQRQIRVRIRFRLSPGGRVIDGPGWADADDNPDRAYAAHQAMAAVSNGQPYAGLPEGLYNTPITIIFDAERACAGR